MTEITRILTAIDQGDAQAANELLPLVYDELRRLAAQKLSHERPGQTLQATALVHDAYIRLVDTKKVQHWDSRGHFFAAAADAMRKILVDRARSKGRQKHGGGRQRIDLDGIQIADDTPSDDLLALDNAMKKLAREDQESAKLVELRFFAGLTLEQTAMAMGIGKRTADRRWAYARAWLYQELRHGEDSVA